MSVYDESCWTCKCHLIGGVNLLGKCSRNSNMEIPPEMVDKGCHWWVPEEPKQPKEEELW